MAYDLRIVLPNRPGTLLGASETIAAAGVPLLGFCSDIRPGERWGYLHVLVEDPAAAQSALETAGIEVTSVHQVDLNAVDKHTGVLAEEIKRYSEAGRNIEVMYLTSEGQIVIGTEDMLEERLGVRMKDAGS